MAVLSSVVYHSSRSVDDDFLVFAVLKICTKLVNTAVFS